MSHQSNTCHHCDEPAVGIATGKLHNQRLPKAGIPMCEAHGRFATKFEARS
jgi:hypothetical protein